ncbi:MAG: DUF5011 domain-containing protein [Blautia sp.]|nr:DUF5011 domain-containing protein [Blautia sp.]
MNRKVRSNGRNVRAVHIKGSIRDPWVQGVKGSARKRQFTGTNDAVRRNYVSPRAYTGYKYRAVNERRYYDRIRKWGYGSAEPGSGYAEAGRSLAGMDEYPETGWIPATTEEYAEAAWDSGETDGYSETVEIPAAEESPEEQAAVLSERSRKRKLLPVLAACFVFVLMLAGGYGYYQLPHRCVRESVAIEAGEECPSVADFLEWECESAAIVSGIDENMEFNHVGDHEVTIHLYHQDIATILHVTDTTPPEIRTRDKTIMLGDDFALEDFVTDVTDNTDWEIAYKEEPDIRHGGIYTLILEAKDEGGNVAEAEARLEVIEDVTPPVIEGVQELRITLGEGVSYKKGVTVTDDYDDAVALVVDNSAVDLDTPGDYEVIYRATDKYGNEAEVSTVLHVREVPKDIPAAVSIPMTEEAVNAEADKILASITNSSMSQYEVIRAIYDWVNKKIAYKNGTPKTDWVEGAYYGIVLQRGDCFAFAMASKCLLTRAGITNMDIERIRVGNGMHFWNLVDIGEGWHHFDTCRRGDGATFFYLTDAELMAYSDTHTATDYPNGSHYYDRSLYPEIP